jgi:predicted AAA+ superfamily ATPase
MLQHIADDSRTVVSLDDHSIRALARTDPGLFLQRYVPPLLIDEIQYAPELLPLIKLAVDRTGRNGEFWLTGSQSFHLMRNVSESLAGRVGILTLLGLSSSEISGVPSQAFDPDPTRLVTRMRTVPKLALAEVYQRIATGSMPRLWTEPNMDHETYYRSYVATYLQRDIRDLSQVADEMVFLTFMTAVAARTACPLVMDELARDVGVSAPTAKRWLSILASSGIITLVPPYHNNILSRMTKMPLLHMLDTGLAAYLLRWTNPEALERGAMAGQFFESYVFAELYKSFAFTGQDPPLYYYRDKNKREIDVLIHRNGVLHPLEIKKSAAPGASALKNFRALDPLSTSSPGQDSLKTDVGSGGVICMADDVIPIDALNSLIPAWLI